MVKGANQAERQAKTPCRHLSSGKLAKTFEQGSEYVTDCMPWQITPSVPMQGLGSGTEVQSTPGERRNTKIDISLHRAPPANAKSLINSPMAIHACRASRRTGFASYTAASHVWSELG